MSYLNPLRLVFSGQFQADPSTVNNDVRHFDNATFQPQFQQPQSGSFMLNGWWNPEGSGAFRLVACAVTTVYYRDGTSTQSPQVDPVVGLAIADANVRVAGKIVDLDPQQQMVSEIWGLIVRLTDGDIDYFAGPFAQAPFSDIWFRAQGPGGQGDMGMGTFWQSVIGPVAIRNPNKSRFLTELAEAAPAGLLSIKFNTDGYNMNANTAQFTLGRIVGSIGPASPSEPKRFVIGRQLLPQISQGSPAGPMNFMPAVVDQTNRKIIADFGNAIPTEKPGGALAGIGDLQLGYLDANNAFQVLDTLPAAVYTQTNPQFSWYTNTAGIQAFPQARPLTDAEMATLAGHRVAIAAGGTPAVQENVQGLYARADEFVLRLDPTQTAEVELWAAQFGVALAGARIVAFADTSQLQPAAGDTNDGLGQPPAFGVPETAITFSSPAATDRQGRTTLAIGGGDPGNPRGYIDGQVYGVRYLLATIAEQLKTPLDSNFDPAFGWNPSDFVSVLVFDPYPVPDEPTWYGLQPIWQQYANLYPVMERVLDLARYEDVAAHAQVLAFAYGLPRENPNHMPVTRDLSGGKRDAILRWLTHPGPDGKPRLGQPPIPPPPRPGPKLAVARPPAPARPPAAGAADPAAGAKAYARSFRRTFRVPDHLDA